MSQLRTAVVAQQYITYLWSLTLRVVGFIPAGCLAFFLPFLSLSSVFLVWSLKEIKHYRVSLTKNGCSAVQLGAKQA